MQSCRIKIIYKCNLVTMALRWSFPVLLFSLCSLVVLVKAATPCPTSEPPGRAVALGVKCSENGANVIWSSNGGVDVINLEYVCSPMHSNRTNSPKSNILNWAEFMSGNRNLPDVPTNDSYKCVVSGCYVDDFFYDLHLIPAQSCTFDNLPLSPSPSLSPSSLQSVSPSLLLSSILPQPTPEPEPQPIATPNSTCVCCTCTGTEETAQTGARNKRAAKPSSLDSTPDYNAVLIGGLAIVILVIMLQSIAICVLCQCVRSLKKSIKCQKPMAI